MEQNKEKLKGLFENHFGEEVISFSPLPISGSDRKYFRLISAGHRALGVYNPHTAENTAYIYFSNHFKEHALNVPEVYCSNEAENIYLVQDLGDTTLFSYLQQERKSGGFPDSLIEKYREVLRALPLFQVKAASDIDYSYCYPRSAFDKQSMMWDLNYFKYYFLKLAGIAFDEQRLEDDFERLTTFLLTAPHNFFLYRDFQSRNILLHDNSIWFIDFQGGRSGALQYDLASLLYDAKADIPPIIREQLLDYYLSELSKQIDIDFSAFRGYYYAYVYIRIMQAMGAYGFRGYYEKKEHFLQSIPYALNNLSWLLHNTSIPVDLPVLMPLFEKLVNSEKLRNTVSDAQVLRISINSFSYKRGIPVDESGNGGGFVFDCRAINNPGRHEKYARLNGKDSEVIEFLSSEEDSGIFIADALEMVSRSIKVYAARNFTSLMINFGCTGGQHRSVYCAEQVAKVIMQRFPYNVSVRHREMEMKEKS